MRPTASWWREPGTGTYARPEREWRWLVAKVPAEATSAVDIEDRYLVGTSLRLRHMHGDDSDVYKLTQKVRPRADDPSVAAITTIYLSADEHARLAVLPAQALSKRRYRWAVAGHDLAVDEMLGRWRGLVLVELEHETEADRPAVAGGVDVTGDDRFSGGALATATDDDVVVVLALARRLCPCR